MFRVLDLESGDRVLCLVSIGKVGALSLVGIWQRHSANFLFSTSSYSYQ